MTPQLESYVPAIKEFMIKAVFFDIDGTLVPFGDHCLPESARRAIADIRRSGVKVFIATGRHPEWINNLGDTEWDGFVAANGSYCVLGDRRTEVYRREIPADDLQRLVPFVEHHPMPFVVVPAGGGIFRTSSDRYLTESQSILRFPDTPVRPVSDALTMPVVQMMVFGSPEQISESQLFQRTLLHCEPTSWSRLFSDIVPEGSNKGVGIDMMIRHFGIDLSETMAFGDGGNDIAMLRHAGIGVAMGNAAPEVKAAADYVTTDVDADGIAAALRHFGLTQ